MGGGPGGGGGLGCSIPPLGCYNIWVLGGGGGAGVWGVQFPHWGRPYYLDVRG